MIARIVEFAPTCEAAAEFVHAVEQTALRIAREQAGCIGTSIRLRGQSVIGLSLWESPSAVTRYDADLGKLLRPYLMREPRTYGFRLRMFGPSKRAA